MDESVFRNRLLDAVVKELTLVSGVEAIWVAGSAANQTMDLFSDIDLNILADSTELELFRSVETSLASVSPITHIYHEPKTIWPDLTQKIYFLADSPKYFFVDVAWFPVGANEILREFMERQRHGTPVVLFDRSASIVPTSTDLVALRAKQRTRLDQIRGSFPVYRTTVLKEIERGNTIDAIAFYQGGLVRPLVELLGILYRPYQFDFGQRYLRRSLPQDVFAKLEHWIYVADFSDLKTKVDELSEFFDSTLERVSMELSG